jgi:hypothetical protein
MSAYFIWFFGESDSANAGASCRPSLDLNYDFAAQFFCCYDSFIGTRRGATRWNLESVRSENGFALIFVKSRHGSVLFRMKTPKVQPASVRRGRTAVWRVADYTAR